MCEYNNMVHISDWYHIIMNILEIDSTTNAKYSPDSDHDTLNIWGNIRCHCRGQSNCDNTARKPRDELVMMRMCGDPDGDYDNGDFSFYSAYVRQGDWKLVVKSSVLSYL